MLLCHVPSLLITGPRATGKTFSSEVSVAFLGKNADDICVAKQITLPALRDRYTEDHFPLIVHDCKDSDTISTAIHECFEGRVVLKHKQELIPGTSVAFTCNEGPMEHMRNRCAENILTNKSDYYPTKCA